MDMKEFNSLAGTGFDMNLDEFSSINQDQAARSPFGRVLTGLGVAGKVLQPFAAPQQLIFAGIKAAEDSFDGNDATNGWDTLKRGGRSALSYATWGGYQAAGLKQGDPRAQAITGYELFKGAGAPDWVSRWGGTAADFFLDVPLVGALGKAAKVNKLTAGLRIGENMAQAFDSPAALRAFVGGVAASPFTTQPIKTAVEAIPQGLRQQGRERLIDPILNLRSVPGNEFDAVKPTLGQTLIARNMGVPEPVAAALERKTAVSSQYAVLHNEALAAFDQAKKGLDFQTGRTLDNLVGKLADASSPADRLALEGQIRALETTTGRAGLFDDAIRATNKGIQFDTFSAEKLNAAGLMSDTALQAYQRGDKRHLRRVYAMYGEDAPSQLRRIMDRNAPADVTFDVPKLEDLYNRSLQGGVTMPNTIPTAQDFSKAVQAAYVNLTQHPADFLKDFFQQHQMSQQHISDILDGIGKDYAEKAGITYKPDDSEIVRYFTARRAAEAPGGAGGMTSRGTKAVTTQRQEVSDWYADALGEVSSFTERLNAQARVTSRAATLNGTIRDIRQYLTDNNLIETVGTADMGAIHKTAGLRVLSGEQARSLGNGFKEGEVIPTEVHRILLEQVDTRQAAPLGLAWQWYSSRWQGVKLANPGSILTNLRSAFVQADHAGQSIPQLLGGIRDYLALHRQAVRGDGAMDVNAKVGGVTMRELFDHGAFTHNTLMNSEVVQQSSRLMDELANPAGNPLQRSVAAMQEWLTGTAQGAQANQLYGKAVAPMRWLGDTYGRVDSMMKGGLYMSLRKQGVAPEKAARVADETFFNYENVPYVVDGLRRFGLAGMPFASFKLLATGRFFRSLYQNPYGVERYYRLGNSSRAAMADQQEQTGENSLTAYDKGSPDYIRQGLYIPMGKDSEGRVRAVRLDDILPETAIFDSFNADGVAGTAPPAFQLVGQLISGKGYQGRDVYRTGGTYAETARLTPQEAARGVVAQLWQFGAYPWAPGQPMTERIVKAIADKAVPVETIASPTAQATLKLLTQGPAGALDPAPFSTEKKGTQPVPDVGDALARIFGVKTYPVSTSPSVPGSYQSNLIGRDMDLQTLNKMEAGEMKQAQTDAQRAEIRRRYDELRAPIVRKQRGE